LVAPTLRAAQREVFDRLDVNVGQLDVDRPDKAAPPEHEADRHDADMCKHRQAEPETPSPQHRPSMSVPHPRRAPPIRPNCPPRNPRRPPRIQPFAPRTPGGTLG